jgi:peptidyl-prolyl cis-trans isomerase B (cyclophilin B)|tara:strand:- start:1344 stop:1844 length:501 start_codon:yes stop_codon:yes gene_type:complete
MFVFETNYGSFTVELDFANAPISSKNFQNYADSGFYDGTIFHRVINDFMIQGGGFEPGLTQKSTEESIENEANNGLSNELGTLAMARTADPHSASSQFFINVSDNFFLDHKDTSSQGWGYAVFGKVVEGMDTINKIKACKTGSQLGHQDVPEEDVLISSVKRIEEA